MYDVNEKKLHTALETESWQDKKMLMSDALKAGWRPDFQKAIEEWHTACLELDIGEGYVNHILEEHSERDLIECILSVLESQLEEFREESEEGKEPIDPKDYCLFELNTSEATITDSYSVNELDAQRTRLAEMSVEDRMTSDNIQLIIATPKSLGMQGPKDVPATNIPVTWHNANQIVGVMPGRNQGFKDMATANAERWKKILESQNEESEELINPDDYRLFEINIEGIVVNSYPLTELELQRGRLYKMRSVGRMFSDNVKLVIATPVSLGMLGPADIPHFDVLEYDESQIVGVMGDCGEKLKEAANTNAERWKQLIQVLGT